MARLSIGSQHFQAKEKKPMLSIEQAKIRSHEQTTDSIATVAHASEETPVIAPSAQATIPAEVKTLDSEKEECNKYSAQNRMLAMRNSELSMRNAELSSVIEDLELQITSLKHELEQKQNPASINLEKLVSMLESNQSQVLKYIWTHGKENAMNDKRPLDNLSGVVSTSTPNTSKSPIEPSSSFSEPARMETSKSSIDASHLQDFSFNARAESTPNTMSKSSSESSTMSADLAMLDDRSIMDKPLSRAPIRAESLENILDSVDSAKAPKRLASSSARPEQDPLEYFAKRRAMDSRVRNSRERKLQPARSVKIEVKSENLDASSNRSVATKGTQRIPLSTVSSNIQKKTGKDSANEIFDFVDKAELLKGKPLARERRA